MANLHAFEPPFIHGHLTPHNIFIKEDATKALIADFGFKPLKKYAGLFNNYRNKSAYSAPEQLSAKGNTVGEETAKCDVYSLGIVIW